jgi:hypothetical protein
VGLYYLRVWKYNACEEKRGWLLKDSVRFKERQF